MPGSHELDKMCTHEASLGLTFVQALLGTHILEVFVHEVEGEGNDQKLLEICRDRCAKHAENALALLFEPVTLTKRAGTGRRQGSSDVGPISIVK